MHIREERPAPSPALGELRRALGGRRPDRVTQEPFDFDDSHLRRLIRLAPDQLPSPGDLWDYSQDLRYSKTIDRPLLVWLLPACLQALHHDLRGGNPGVSGYGAFVDEFYPALIDRRILDEYLAPRQADAVAAFLRASILDEIANQRTLRFAGKATECYRWTGALASYGILRPDLDTLWNDWWSLQSPGAAIAVVQYTSALIYGENENPVFAPWTRDAGGGPPCLWEFSGALYKHAWLDVNVRFLRRALTAPAVRDVLRRAVAVLANQPDGKFEDEHAMAARVEAGLLERMGTLEARCAELPVFLETVHPSCGLWNWSR
jgi:hypothetical protein